MDRMFGHHPWTVGELVSGVDKGSVRLPDIQRPFVWPNAKVRDLVDSMYRGYPVGELISDAQMGAIAPQLKPSSGPTSSTANGTTHSNPLGSPRRPSQLLFASDPSGEAVTGSLRLQPISELAGYLDP